MPLRDFSVTIRTWLICTHQSIGFTPYGYHQGPWKTTIVRHSWPRQAALGLYADHILVEEREFVPAHTCIR